MHGEGLRNPVWSKTITDDAGQVHQWEAGTLPDGSLIIKTSRPSVTTVDVLEKSVMEEAA